MAKNRTALLISYYWPPAGGAGVHRWLRFSQYFKENGWDLHVYCPENGAWPTLDPSLNEHVSKDLIIVRRPIFEPHRYLGKKNNPNVGAGLTQKGKSSLFQSFVIWTRGNLFIPDARAFWIKPSVRFLKKYLKDHPEIDTIISTGPPHTCHMIGLGLKKNNPNLNWVADFRDPWTEIDFYQDLLPGKWADKRHKAMEKEVLTTADKVITISEHCAEGLRKISERGVEVVTNGFNFPEFDAESVQLDEKLTIAHFGSMPHARNPTTLWDALALLLRKNEDLKKDLVIKLVGPVDHSVFESIDKNNLATFVEHIPSVSHAESLDQQRTAQILLLMANRAGNVKGILTGKVFEYLGAKRPILAFGEEHSDLEKVITSTEAGAFIPHDEVESTIQILEKWYLAYQRKELKSSPKNLDQFSSRSLAKDFIHHLK
jgi:glycosyltransferase involved in cell wall biosynthesis